MIWTRETIQYMRSDKNQRNLLVDHFEFFKRAANGQVQLKGTKKGKKYYFRVQGWTFIRYELSPHSFDMFKQYGVKPIHKNYKECRVSLEDVLDDCNEELQAELLFHLDLFQ